MVDEGQLVVDGLGDVVGLVALARPVGFADEDDNAGRDADKEGEGRAQTHDRHLHVGLLLTGLHLLRGMQLLGLNQRPYDAAVTYEDDDKGQRCHQRNGDPRTHVALKVLVRGGGTPAVFVAYNGAVFVESVLQTARPEDVRVLDARDEEESEAVELRATRFAHFRLVKRETHGDETVDGEGDQDPDGRVARGVVHELLKLTRHRVNLLEDHHLGVLQPLRNHADAQDADIGKRHNPQVNGSRRSQELPAAHDDQDQQVADDPEDEDDGGDVDPQ